MLKNKSVELFFTEDLAHHEKGKDKDEKRKRNKKNRRNIKHEAPTKRSIQSYL